MPDSDPDLRLARLPEVEQFESYFAETADIPSVSFDRSLSHFAFNIDIDMQAVQDFYYGLPHPDKLPLDRLHIHFSSSRPAEELTGNVLSGDFNRKGTKHIWGSCKMLTPELNITDRPTIRIFLGSAMLELSNADEYRNTSKTALSSFMSEDISETLAHELTHFAQTSEADLVLPTASGRKSAHAKYLLASLALGTLRNRKDIVVGFGVGVLSEAISEGGIRSIVAAIGAASLSHIANRKDRKTLQAQKDYKQYKERENEVDAREHETSAPVLCEVLLHPFRKFPKGHSLEDFIKPVGDRSGIYQANFNHRTLAYTPRGEDPRQIRNAANMREISGILSKTRLKRPKKK